MAEVTLKNPGDLAARLALNHGRELLLVDAPKPLERLLSAQRGPGQPVRPVEGRSLRSVKELFPAILIWREDRVGSRAVFESAVRRLEPDGILWVVTAMKKVMGPATPAAHRLELSDLRKAFAGEELTCDRQVRVSAWHVAYQFVRR